MRTSRTLPLFVAALALTACGPNSGDGNPGTGPTGSSTTDATDTPWGPGDNTPLDPNAPVEPLAEWNGELFEDSALVWWMPEQPRAVVWVFHGANMTAGVANLTETVAILNELALVGIGFIAPSSVDTPPGNQWDTSVGPGNADLARVDRIRDHVMAQSDLTASTPVLAWGFSNGADMARALTDHGRESGWDVRALSAHNGSISTPSVPAVFVISENDAVASNSRIRGDYDDGVDRGDTVALYEAVEAPLDPLRFNRISGYRDETSQFQFDELVEWGVISATGDRLIDLSQVDATVADLEANSAGWSPAQAGQQLRVVWCTHQIDGQFALEERDFFLDQL